MDIAKFADSVIELSPAFVKGFIKYENNHLTRGEITLPQSWALDYLSQNGRSKMSVLARRLKISAAAATGLIDRLISQGLVARKGDTADRRIVWIELTPKGTGVVRDIKKEKTHAVIRLFGKLSAADRENYLRILRQVVKTIDSLQQ